MKPHTMMKKARKLLGLSQEEMGKLLDVHQSAVSRLESGKQCVEIAHLRKLARARARNFPLQDALDRLIASVIWG